MLEIIEKYSHRKVESRDAGYPMFLLVTFKNLGVYADRGPGKPSPYKYSSYFYGELPEEGPRFWMSYTSDTQIRNLRKRDVKDVSQNAYRFVIKKAFEPQKQVGDSTYNIKQMVENL